MKSKKIIKAMILDIFLMAVDAWSIYAIMRGGLGSFMTAVYSTLIFISVPVFFYFNYMAFAGNKFTFTMDELDEDDEFKTVLNQFKVKPELRGFVDTACDQLDRFGKKRTSVVDVLQRNYNEGLAEFGGISQVMDDSRDVIYANLKDIINRMTIYDSGSDASTMIDESIRTEQREMKRQQIEYMKKLLSNNEVILIEVDKLLIEATKMNAGNVTEKQIDGIKDIVRSLQSMQAGDVDLGLQKKYDETLDAKLQ